MILLPNANTYAYIELTIVTLLSFCYVNTQPCIQQLINYAFITVA